MSAISGTYDGSNVSLINWSNGKTTTMNFSEKDLAKLTSIVKSNGESLKAGDSFEISGSALISVDMADGLIRDEIRALFTAPEATNPAPKATTGSHKPADQVNIQTTAKTDNPPEEKQSDFVKGVRAIFGNKESANKKYDAFINGGDI